MSRMTSLPPGYALCRWCSHGVRLTTEGHLPSRCPGCGLSLSAGTRLPDAPANPATTSKTPTRNRRNAARITDLSDTPAGKPVCAVDPGARYTGVVIRDGDVVLLASTLVRDPDTDPVTWGRQVVREIQAILAVREDMPVAIEGVSDPKGFKNGQRASLNPAWIMRAAVVLGAVSNAWPDAVIVPPGGNGSQHTSHYPACLKGRRPADLPGDGNGAGTRAHEQSAYDVAGKAASILWPTPIPDLRELAQAG